MEICRIAEERVGPEMVECLTTIGVEVGDDSGLELSSLTFCLDALLSQPPFKHARADIKRQSGDVLRVDYLEVDDGGPSN